MAEKISQNSSKKHASLRKIPLMRIFTLLIVAALFIFCWVEKVTFLEKLLSHALGTRVSVEKFQMGWDKFTLHKVKIYNSQPCSWPYAFSAESLTVEASPVELFSRVRHIKRVALNRPCIHIEFYSKFSNNWTRLIEEIPQNESKKEWTIDTLLITQLKCQIENNRGKPIISPPPIPFLTLRNVGSQNKLTTSKMGEKVLEMYKLALPLKKGLFDIPDKSTIEKMQGFFSSVRKLFERNSAEE